MWNEIIIIVLLCVVVVMVQGSMKTGETCGMQKLVNSSWIPNFGCAGGVQQNASIVLNESAVNETAS